MTELKFQPCRYGKVETRVGLKFQLFSAGNHEESFDHR